jgi:hypothetical protein
MSSSSLRTSAGPSMVTRRVSIKHLKIRRSCGSSNGSSWTRHIYVFSGVWAPKGKSPFPSRRVLSMQFDVGSTISPPYLL